MMHNSIIRLHQLIVVVTILMLPLIYIPFAAVGYSLSVPIAFVLFIFTMAFLYVVGRNGRIRQWQLYPLLSALSLSLVYLLSSIHAHALNFEALKTIIQVFIIIGFFLYAQRKLQLNNGDFRAVLPLITILVCIPIIAVYIYYARFMGNAGPDSLWTRTKNSLGALLYVQIFLNFMIFRYCRNAGETVFFALLALFLSTVGIVALGSRGSQLALVIGIGSFFLWGRLRYKNILLFILLACIPIFIYIYLNLDEFINETMAKNYVHSVTGANLYSGRQLIWPAIIDAVQSYSPLFGLGADAEASHALMAQGIHESWSAHDLYLQVYLKGGLVGCIFLCVLIYSVWKAMFRMASDEWHLRVASAFFLGMLAYDVFEVSLLQNNLHAGMPMWMMLAMLLNQRDDEHVSLGLYDGHVGRLRQRAA